MHVLENFSGVLSNIYLRNKICVNKIPKSPNGITLFL